MSRQLYPILLSITIALAIGVYMHPGEARKWIQQAGQWGTEVLRDTVRATDALADDLRSGGAQPGFASTNPPLADPTWAYAADSQPTASTLGTPAATPPSANAMYQTGSAQPSWPGAGQPMSGNGTAYPRVLAGSAAPATPPYQGPATPSYPSTERPPNTAFSGSPYETTNDNPLRPSMPREAPWATGSPDPYATAPAGSPYEAAQPLPRVGNSYPRVQWAGDWRDYQGVPDSVKPTEQSQAGFLPPPDINSTVATVDRYLPGPSSSQPPAPQTRQTLPAGPAPGPANVPAYQYPQAGIAGMAPQQSPQFQTQMAADAALQNPSSAYSPAPPGVAPAAPYQPDFDATAARANNGYAPPPTTSGRHSIRITPATPFRSLAGTASPAENTTSQNVTAPLVASLPQSPVGPAIAGPATPAGAQMESPDPVADLTLCEGAQILARVGSELVLGSEVFPLANETLLGVKGIEKESESNIAMAREQLVRRILPQHIEMKLLYVDAKRNLPPEAIDNINKQLSKRFEDVEIAERLKKLNLGSRRELEEQLKKRGSSLELEKRAFIEKSIAQQWVYEKLRKEEEITHEELLDYYQAHTAEYDHPTRVRWEHLEVTFERHPDKREAWQQIATMGNSVQQGKSFADVAKESSEGAMASQGGQRDWLTQGSLKSDVLDRCLFSLSVGEMSPILEDETGFHIVRVVEREDAYRTPFEDIQGEVREKLKDEHKQARLKELINRLRGEIPVWTVFEQQTADSRASEVEPDSRPY